MPCGITESLMYLKVGAIKRYCCILERFDWKTEVWINDIKIGEHVGGYSPFHFDISPYLNATGEQNMVVRVYDPTDKGPQARRGENRWRIQKVSGTLR